MAELDKKISKAQPDLVQSVLEAHEKRLQDRVDMLVTGAIKQLKMSRFKPDQTTCISLAYLARINPDVFSQSNTIKETLKSLLRRENGPAPNIKGKSEIILPALSANILLATCDSVDVRSIILQRIQQWMVLNPKGSDIVHNLLATICMKCHSDPQTICTLTQMRQHWLQYMKENFETYGSVPDDLCAAIRGLLLKETNAEQLSLYVSFLLKHDENIQALSREIGDFINKRPMTLESLLVHELFGTELSKMLLQVFIKLFKHLKEKPTLSSGINIDISDLVCQKNATNLDPSTNMIGSNKNLMNQQPISINIKIEKDENCDTKPIKMDIDGEKIEPKQNNDLKKEEQPAKKSTDPQQDKTEQVKTESDIPVIKRFIPPVYVKIPSHGSILTIEKNTLDAVLMLLSMTSESDQCKLEYDELMNIWLVIKVGKVDNQMASIFEDFGLTKLYDLPDQLRSRLALSNNQNLIELSLQGASTAQLLKLLLQCGTTTDTVSKILKRMGTIQDLESIRAELHDDVYFYAVIDYYIEKGSTEAKDFLKRYDQLACESS